MEQSQLLGKDDIHIVEDQLESLKSAHNLQALACQPCVLFSSRTPGEKLIAFARDHEINEIVLGIKKKSKVGKLMFGSNAQYVILNAPCPVVTV